jgi:hypothetical protein
MLRQVEKLRGHVRVKATLRAARRHHREGSLGGLAGGAKLLFGLNVRSGYNLAVPNYGSQEAHEASTGCMKAPWFDQREVKFARYFIGSNDKTANLIGDDRTVPALRHTVRRSNLP